MTPLIRNTFYSTLTNSLQSLANALILVLLARPLGTEEFGRLLLAVSFTSIFAIMVEYGFRWYATKEVSQNPGEARAIAGQIFNAQLLLAAGATLLAFLAMRLLAYPPRTMAVIALVWASAVLVAFNQVTRSIFRGLDMFPCDTALNLVLLVATVLALVPPLIFQPTVIAFAAAILAARFVFFAAGQILFARRVGRPDRGAGSGRGGRLLAATLAYGIQVMIFRLLLEWNTIVLHQFRGNAAVGIYQAAFRFFMATMTVGDILLQAFFPVISRAAATDRRRFIKTSTTLNRYLLAAGAYMAGAFFLFADELVRWMFGASFAPAVSVLRILALAILAFFLSTASSLALIALGRQGTRARAGAAVLAFNAAASLLLIPAHGAQGAAAAMAATLCLYAALNHWLIHRAVGRLFFDRRSLKSFLLVLCGSAGVFLIRGAAPLLAAAAYAGLGLLLFATASSGEEKREMLQALRLSPPPAPGVDA